jgi:hypothetical protein
VYIAQQSLHLIDRATGCLDKRTRTLQVLALGSELRHLVLLARCTFTRTRHSKQGASLIKALGRHYTVTPQRLHTSVGRSGELQFGATLLPQLAGTLHNLSSRTIVHLALLESRCLLQATRLTQLRIGLGARDDNKRIATAHRVALGHQQPLDAAREFARDGYLLALDITLQHNLLSHRRDNTHSRNNKHRNKAQSHGCNPTFSIDIHTFTTFFDYYSS